MYKEMKRIFNTQMTDRNNFGEFLKAQKEILKVFFLKIGGEHFLASKRASCFFTMTVLSIWDTALR